MALSVSPLYVACGSDDDAFKPASASAGEGGEMDTPTAGKGGSGKGGTTGESGAGGAAEEGGAGGAPPVVGAGGQGGEGGTPIVCTDEDNDGVTNCDGDCKDIKPYISPNLPEICGDGIDNDCSFVVDDLCGGLGTYVSVLAGDDLNPGTKLLPVQSIGKGIENARTIRITTMAPIDVYVAEGGYGEKVVLEDGISLLGGHNCSDLVDPFATCDWSRDPSLYTSTITNIDLQGVVAGHTVFASTKIDGFTILGMDDAGDAPAYPGTAAITVAGGSPTISNNLITAGDSVVPFSEANARSVGIAVLAPTNDPVGAIIDGNTITAGSAVTYSVGLLFDGATFAPSPLKTYAVVTGNKINAGAALWSFGVFARNTGFGTLIQDNAIGGGLANGAEAQSWGINIEGRASIDSNRINLPPAAPACTATGEWCGGIFSAASTSEITNNVILGVTESAHSAGVYLAEFEQPAGSVVLNSNYIDGAGNKLDGEHMSAAVLFFKGGEAGYTTIGRIANNILIAGLGNHRFGLREPNSAGRIVHPDWLFNNAFYNETSDTPVTSSYYHYWDGSVYVPKTTIIGVNTAEPQFATVGGNIDGSCDVDATYHLQTGSICIDAGVAYDAPAFDYEGDGRPINDEYDIGADETD